MLILALKLISELQATTLPMFMFNKSNTSLQKCHSHLPGHEFHFSRPAGTSLPSQVSTFPSRILTSYVGTFWENRASTWDVFFKCFMFFLSPSTHLI